MGAIGRTKCYSVRSLTRARPGGRGWHPGGLGVGLATVPRSTAIRNSCTADVEGSGTAGTEKEKSGPFSSIRIVLDWRRKHTAIDASGVSRADRACLTVRRAKRLSMTSIPRFADVGSPVLFRRGMCRRDHSNNRQRSCVHRQCEEPYRKFAHASLPLMRKRSWIGSLGAIHTPCWCVAGEWLPAPYCRASPRGAGNGPALHRGEDQPDHLCH
jgi:hypothetical protein